MLERLQEDPGLGENDVITQRPNSEQDKPESTFNPQQKNTVGVFERQASATNNLAGINAEDLPLDIKTEKPH